MKNVEGPEKRIFIQRELKKRLPRKKSTLREGEEVDRRLGEDRRQGIYTEAKLLKATFAIGLTWNRFGSY